MMRPLRMPSAVTPPPPSNGWPVRMRRRRARSTRKPTLRPRYVHARPTPINVVPRRANGRRGRTLVAERVDHAAERPHVAGRTDDAAVKVAHLGRSVHHGAVPVWTAHGRHMDGSCGVVEKAARTGCCGRCWHRRTRCVRTAPRRGVEGRGGRTVPACLPLRAARDGRRCARRRCASRPSQSRTCHGEREGRVVAREDDGTHVGWSGQRGRTGTRIRVPRRATRGRHANSTKG